MYHLSISSTIQSIECPYRIVIVCTVQDFLANSKQNLKMPDSLNASKPEINAIAHPFIWLFSKDLLDYINTAKVHGVCIKADGGRVSVWTNGNPVATCEGQGNDQSPAVRSAHNPAIATLLGLQIGVTRKAPKGSVQFPWANCYKASTGQ